MSIWKWAAACGCAAVLSGCAGGGGILRVRALSEPVDPVSNVSRAEFVGIHALTQASNNTRILMVHGIGWTQEQKDKDRNLSDDFIKALVKFYGVKPDGVVPSQLCPSTTLGKSKGPEELKRAKKEEPKPTGGLPIRAVEYLRSFTTDDPYLRPYSDQIGCLENTTISIGSGKTITVYRYFWDDMMWNTFEWPHIGYDDQLGEAEKNNHPGYDDPWTKRAKRSRKIKDAVVTYGFTDAALYLGPVGKIMREGVQAAICATLSTVTMPINANQASPQNFNDLCAYEPSQKESFAIISHSLGSRIIFDVLKTDLTKEVASRIEVATLNKQFEVFMMANQLPLVAVGRLGDARSKERLASKDLKFIAVSEINDLLSYELVPYFEHMYYVRCINKLDDAKERKDAGCKVEVKPGDQDANEYTARRGGPLQNLAERKAFIEQLGFDVVDIRAEYATVYPVVDLGDPATAHSGQFTSQPVIDLVMCGAKKDQGLKQNGDCRGR